MGTKLSGRRQLTDRPAAAQGRLCRPHPRDRTVSGGSGAGRSSHMQSPHRQKRRRSRRNTAKLTPAMMTV